MKKGNQRDANETTRSKQEEREAEENYQITPFTLIKAKFSVDERFTDPNYLVDEGVRVSGLGNFWTAMHFIKFSMACYFEDFEIARRIRAIPKPMASKMADFKLLLEAHDTVILNRKHDDCPRLVEGYFICFQYHHLQNVCNSMESGPKQKFLESLKMLKYGGAFENVNCASGCSCHAAVYGSKFHRFWNTVADWTINISDSYSDLIKNEILRYPTYKLSETELIAARSLMVTTKPKHENLFIGFKMYMPTMEDAKKMSGYVSIFTNNVVHDVGRQFFLVLFEMTKTGDPSGQIQRRVNVKFEGTPGIRLIRCVNKKEDLDVIEGESITFDIKEKREFLMIVSIKLEPNKPAKYRDDVSEFLEDCTISVFEYNGIVSSSIGCSLDRNQMISSCIARANQTD